MGWAERANPNSRRNRGSRPYPTSWWTRLVNWLRQRLF